MFQKLTYIFKKFPGVSYMLQNKNQSESLTCRKVRNRQTVNEARLAQAVAVHPQRPEHPWIIALICARDGVAHHIIAPRMRSQKSSAVFFLHTCWIHSNEQLCDALPPSCAQIKVTSLAPRDRWVHKSTIFVNKKSNFSIKNLNNSITTLLVFFPGPLEPYFCLGKNQRSKFANFILKLTFWKNMFSRFERQIQYNRKSHSKIHAFSSNY